jgi:hypothetical protein
MLYFRPEMTDEEYFFKTMVNETQIRLAKESEASAAVDWVVIGRMSDNKKHNAQLKISYGGLPVLIINYPIRGYEREVDIVAEVNRAECKLFADAVAVCGARGLMTLIHLACIGNGPLTREIPVMYNDGSTAFPFSEN